MSIKKLHALYQVVSYVVVFFGVVLFLIALVPLSKRVYAISNFNKYQEKVFVIQGVRESHRKDNTSEDQLNYYVEGLIDGNEESFFVGRTTKVRESQLEHYKKLYPPLKEIIVMYNPEAPDLGVRIMSKFGEGGKRGYIMDTLGLFLRALKLLFIGIVMRIVDKVFLHRSKKLCGGSVSGEPRKVRADP